MLFDEEDASLLKKWIVKRLEDISDADSDVLADYVLALLRHDQSKDEVKQLCIEQLDDFLREHTMQFVDDVFTALARKAFRSVNSTLTGGGLSVHIPTRQDTPPPMPSATSASPPGSVRRDRSAGHRSAKRSYFDRDEPDEDDRYKPLNGRDRKMPRRGAGRWGARGGQQPQLGMPVPTVPGQLPATLPFGMPPMPPVGTFPPWMPPPNPNDPMAAFLAAQAAAAWGFPTGGSDGKLDGEKKIVKKVGERCKDYDEKGFCMKGDMCPYEHGIDHIVVPGQESKSEEYDPHDSMLFSTSSNAVKSGRGGRGGARGRGTRGSLRGGRGVRAEFSTTGPNFDRTNTKLVVEQIPEDKLSESAIREFFSTFGTVESVEIHQHKNLAILGFTTWDMAKAAYDSPAPIFDNRFVKVFWCKPAEDADPTSTNGSQNKSFSSRNEQPKEEEPKIDIEEVKRKQEELQKAHEEKMAKKKANEEAAKKLQKRTEELLMLQKEEKRKLMEKLAKKHAASAKKTTSAPPATPSLEALEPNNNGATSLTNPEKAKADATTAALKAQLEALQAEADALGIDQNEPGETFDLEGFRGRGRGRGRFVTAGRGYVPRGRGFSSTYRGRGTYAPRGRGVIPTIKLDNRTKRVAVTIPDMKGDKEEEFRHYLINNGIELEAIEPHPEKDDTRIFTFQDRRNAEKFVFSGNEIPNVGIVSMAWHNAPVTIKPSPSAPPSAGDDNGDTHMADANTSSDHGNDDSYDLAEDDEGRWLPE
ncbi:hypothetical protein BDD12DRAFT_377500 [Trichophaea hybrida]|nr:hypothetical protein BDD12DRAFT_377500 [Trichophaea hybrida]